MSTGRNPYDPLDYGVDDMSYSTFAASGPARLLRFLIFGMAIVGFALAIWISVTRPIPSSDSGGGGGGSNITTVINITVGFDSHAIHNALFYWQENTTQQGLGSWSVPTKYPWVLYDSTGFGNTSSAPYRMWHQYTTNGSIALSVSTDGYSWTLVGLANLTGYHPVVLYSPTAFGNTTAYHYQMWLWNGSVISGNDSVASILFTESDDGLIWTTPVSCTDNPLAPLAWSAPSSLFWQIYGPGSVLFNPTPTRIANQPLTFPYAMYYDVSPSGSLFPGNAESIGLAYSEDGKNWTRFANAPVFMPRGADTADWDATHVFTGRVLRDVDGIYHMFYSGSNNNYADGVVYAHGLGEVISRNGNTWFAKNPANPLFYYTDGVVWRPGVTYTPSVAYDYFTPNATLKTWKMWFSGGFDSGNTTIGYATSSITF